MKLLLIVLLLAVLTSGARLYRPSHPRALAHPVVAVPLSLLWGIARAESGFDPLAVSPDGRDRGMFQLRRDFDEARGVIDPFDPVESVGHAVRILEDARARLGSWDLAVAAYRQGVRGVRRDGATRWYVARVRGTR
jgi:soluble lytic murein transglycosylase-like protein